MAAAAFSNSGRLPWVPYPRAPSSPTRAWWWCPACACGTEAETSAPEPVCRWVLPSICRGESLGVAGQGHVPSIKRGCVGVSRCPHPSPLPEGEGIKPKQPWPGAAQLSYSLPLWGRAGVRACAFNRTRLRCRELMPSPLPSPFREREQGQCSAGSRRRSFLTPSPSGGGQGWGHENVKQRCGCRSSAASP